MRSRALRIAILLFEALWLNVIVPGHTRGVVALPGEERSGGFLWAVASLPSCCATREGNGRGHHRPDSRLPGDPAQHCAICHFAARLSVPVAVDLKLPPLAFAGMAAPQESQAILHILFVSTYDGRAPPHAVPFIA